MDFQDKTITCVDCAQPFVHSAGDQARYAERGLTNDPKRCPACRAKRRNKDAGGAGGGSGGARGGAGGGGRGRAGRFFSASEPMRGRREFFPATCAACGCETTVPFRPVEGRPVFCRDCFQSQKQDR
ncbi:MAG TPA: zinc-ribbon domain containing protein [Phycisphaerae bacterium]|jgi:CxxC-x17-CxxC domain-containing protein|nr:zinc-binding protein [Phycisphaerae bacterium]HOB75939.1 zinc-ribbon domain containing protein [Phycisphaerae bacterium]HOJ55545.1 zinc-ribbon domain containing protein [Phycisphaerae bacterium]HOL27577.1 zinc-ribbon domain containing protein [Phycisphaerae bacterium]HPP21819.1 zinc-ribbon domain containing protein [Phycisphaerae bacterium]